MLGKAKKNLLASSVISLAFPMLLVGCGNIAANPLPAKNVKLHAGDPVIKKFLSLHFTTPTQGWAMALTATSANRSQFMVLTTHTGGKSWRVVLHPTTPGSTVAHDFVSGNQAVIVIASQDSGRWTVYETTDRGRKWSHSTFGSALSSGIDYAEVTFDSNQNGWIAVSSTGLSYAQTQFYHTTDGGHRWSPTSSLLASAIFPTGLTVSGTQLWLTGQNHSSHSNETMISTDSGQQWTPLRVSLPAGITNGDTYPMTLSTTQATLPLLLYLPNSLGFNLYHHSGSGFVPTTTLPIHTTGAPLYAIPNSHDAWVVGQHHLYRTHTGGTNWASIYNKTIRWNAVDFLANGVGYAAESPGSGHPTLLRTQDGGTHWQRVAYKTFR